MGMLDVTTAALVASGLGTFAAYMAKIASSPTLKQEIPDG